MKCCTQFRRAKAEECRARDAEKYCKYSHLPIDVRESCVVLLNFVGAWHEPQDALCGTDRATWTVTRHDEVLLNLSVFSVFCCIAIRIYLCDILHIWHKR